MMGKKSTKGLYNALCFLLAIGIAMFFLLPFLWMISTSLKATAQTFRFPPEWIPNPVQFSNYARGWFDYAPFNLYLRNTLIITLSAVVGSTLSGSLVAFSFGRLRWPGRDVLFIVLLSTMMLPYQVTLIPTFVLFSRLGWVDTYLPLIAPAFLAPPFFVFLLRQFVMSVPLELDEAARIDGCSNWMIYSKIIMPLCKPGLTAIGVFAFMNHWNDFLAPLIYLRSQSNFTLQLGMLMFRNQHEVFWNELMAVSILALLPCLLVFFFAQRWFIQGITLTGLKG